jgi:hypothetical protein
MFKKYSSALSHFSSSGVDLASSNRPSITSYAGQILSKALIWSMVIAFSSSSLTASFKTTGGGSLFKTIKMFCYAPAMNKDIKIESSYDQNMFSS